MTSGLAVPSSKRDAHHHPTSDFDSTHPPAPTHTHTPSIAVMPKKPSTGRPPTRSPHTCQMTRSQLRPLHLPPPPPPPSTSLQDMPDGGALAVFMPTLRSPPAQKRRRQARSQEARREQNLKEFYSSGSQLLPSAMDLHLVLATCVLVLRAQLCQGADWSYTGTHGTDHWASDFETCSGSQQSPIDLNNGEAILDDHLKPFSFEGFESQTMTWNVVNNGHTVQINFINGSASVSDGGLPEKYIVAQLHFHWGEDNGQGSEHTVDGGAYPMEVHIVTYKASYGSLVNSIQHNDGLAVLGFFFQIGSTQNTPFQNIVDALQHVKNQEDTYSMRPFNLLSLFPDVREYYRYLGGLTTPPCSEVVIWTVFRNPIQVSTEQVAAFRDVLYADHSSHGNLPLVNNYRPVQNLSGRKISTSFVPPNSSTSSLVGSTTVIMSLVTAAMARL